MHKVNDEGAQIVSGHTDRFGLFASLPLPHEDAAIKEARYALETLKADGFGLSTHYAGVYLGDKRYDRLMAYLDSVGAVIAVHPVKPADCRTVLIRSFRFLLWSFSWTQQEHLPTW